MLIPFCSTDKNIKNHLGLAATGHAPPRPRAYNLLHNQLLLVTQGDVEIVYHIYMKLPKFLSILARNL